MLRRSCASTDSGKLVVGGVSHAARMSAATHSDLTEKVIVRLRADSVDRQRQRDLMSGGIDVDQAQRATGGCENRSAGDREVAKPNTELAEASGAAGAFRDTAAVAELDLRKPERQAPGRRPLDPTGAQRALRELDTVGLLQPIADGPYHQAELQTDRFRRALERDVATRADAEHRVGEFEPVLHRLAADGDRVASERDGLSDCVSPGVAPNRLVNRIDAERRRAEHH